MSVNIPEGYVATENSNPSKGISIYIDRIDNKNELPHQYSQLFIYVYILDGSTDQDFNNYVENMVKRDYETHGG